MNRTTMVPTLASSTLTTKLKAMSGTGLKLRPKSATLMVFPIAPPRNPITKNQNHKAPRANGLIRKFILSPLVMKVH